MKRIKLFLKGLKDNLFPCLEPFSSAQEEENEKRREKFEDSDSILTKIEHIDGECYAKAFFDACKSLYEEEKTRIKTVEEKSAVLFGTSGLIISLIIRFADDFSPTTLGDYKFIGLFGLLVVIVTLLYFLISMIYVLKTLSIKKHHQLKIDDVINNRLDDEKKYYKKLGCIYCASTVKNYDVINEKVDYLGLAQDYFVRGIIAAGMIILFHIIGLSINN